MKTGPIVLVAAAMIFALALSGAGPQQSAEQLFKTGLYEEEVAGDLQKAIGIYQDLLKRFPGSREAAAKAQLHIGLCYEKLGTQEAERAFQRVIADYPDRPEEVRAAREKLAAILKTQAGAAMAAKGPSVRQIWSGAEAARAVRVSPDGQFVTLIDDLSGNLEIRELASGRTRTVTNGDPSKNLYELAGPSCWSPDGRTLAYGWFVKGNTMGVRLIGVDGSGGRVLYQKENEFAIPLAWSPDGRLLAVEMVRNMYTSFDVGVMSVADGSVKVLKSNMLPKTAPKGLAFSREGRFVFFDLAQADDDAKHDIFAVSIDGGRETRIAEHSANEAVLDWVPDSDALLFTSDRAGTLDAWMVEIADGVAQGEPRLVRKNIGQITPLGFSRDGRYFYRQATEMTDIALATVDLKAKTVTEAPKVLSQPLVGVSYYPRWSPNGEMLAFISDRRESPGGVATQALRIRSAETGEIRDVPLKIARIGALAWAPDSRSVFILGSSDKMFLALWRVDIRTGETAVLTGSDPGANIKLLAPDPDGRSVYYSYFEFAKKRCRIMAVDIATRDVREIYRQDAPPDIFGLSVTPDGKEIAFGTVEPDRTWVMKAIPVAGGQPREVIRIKASASGLGISGPHGWTPDGEGLVFLRDDAKEKNKRDLCYMSVRGGELQRLGLTCDGNPRSFSLHPDGRRLALEIIKQGAEVWVMENFLLPAKK